MYDKKHFMFTEVVVIKEYYKSEILSVTIFLRLYDKSFFHPKQSQKLDPSYKMDLESIL